MPLTFCSSRNSARDGDERVARSIGKKIVFTQGRVIDLPSIQVNQYNHNINIRGRQFKKVFSYIAVLDSPMVQYPSSHLHFPSILNLEPHSSLEVGGCEINFSKKKLLKSKNPCSFVVILLAVVETALQLIFNI